MEGALAPQVTERWSADALSRVAAGEELREWFPRTPRSSFASLDPNDPATWKWTRATLTGRRRANLANEAPRAWEAICALMGGEHRVRTREITDYLILSFPSQRIPTWTSRILKPLSRKFPRFHTAFHLDDPDTKMGLDGWTNALLMVVLFSDITPRGGGTLLACDSPALVARRLAEGEVDFTTNDELKTIVRRCSDFQEVEGKAGDMLLLHPFLLHSATKNHGDCVRILANPMIESRTPLHFATGTRVLSPVEEITQSWLR